MLDKPSLDLIFSQDHLLRKVLSSLSISDRKNVEEVSKYFLISLRTITDKESNFLHVRSAFYGTGFIEVSQETTYDDLDVDDPIKSRCIGARIYCFMNQSSGIIDAKRILNWRIDELYTDTITLFYEPEEVIFCIGDSEIPGIYLNALRNMSGNKVKRLYFNIKTRIDPLLLNYVGEQVFSNFGELRNFYVDVGVQPYEHTYNYLLDCITRRDGIINFTIDRTYTKNRIIIAKKNLERAMLRNIKIGIKIHSLTNDKWVFPWLNSMNERQLSKIIKFEVYTFSILQVVNYLKIITKMKNLKRIVIRLCDGRNYYYESHNKRIIRDPKKRRKIEVPSLKHLTKLQRFSWIKFYRNTIFPDEENYEKLITSFCFKILEEVPSTVTQLHLTGLYSLGSQRTSRISQLFPMLKCLMLSSVQIAEMRCLRRLKNLRYLIVKECPLLKIPIGVRACCLLLCSQGTFFEYCEKWIKKLRNNKSFKKHHNHFDVLKKCIYFNDYRDCDIILRLIHSMEDQVFYNFCI
uniref:F-box domain-containing protein n=1 Tax=Strongyloides venezuelensis TaxID=75913 RepID=A0A0K0FB00_STRVS